MVVLVIVQPDPDKGDKAPNADEGQSETLMDQQMIPLGEDVKLYFFSSHVITCYENISLKSTNTSSQH